MGQGYSFVIPAFNDSAGLSRHFAHFAQVRNEKIQLVIVDDCSEDDTEGCVANVSLPENVRISYHRNSRNTGPGVARNIGIELAEEENVMFLDADDILAPSFFSVMRSAPLENGADFVMFKYHLSRSPHHRFTYEMHGVDRKFFSEAVDASYFPVPLFTVKDRAEAMATINFPWNKLYSRNFLLQAGISFPDLRMHEDVLPHWQSFLRAETFGVLYWAPPLITHYEIPTKARATQYVGEKRMDVFQQLEKVEEELLRHQAAPNLLSVFGEFCDDLFSWMTGTLCDGAGSDAQFWRQKYKKASEVFLEQSAVHQHILTRQREVEAK